MLESWFECKVTYERPGEKGANTKVNESYLMKDFTFASVEKRLTIELQPFVTGEFNINEMKRVKYGEIVETQDESADKWYKCKIMLVTIDEASAKEKKTPVLMLVKAESVPDAITRLNIHMSTSVMDYELTSVNNSPIIDIFQYQAL
jgi:hypothetical protein